MKLNLLYIILLTTLNAHTKCMVMDKTEFINKEKIFVYAEVINTNFKNADLLRRKSKKSKYDYPFYQLRIIKVLKGNIKFKTLDIHKKHTLFDVKRMPDPLNGIADGTIRVFAIRNLKKDGRAMALTSNCIPRVTKKDFN